VGSINLQDDRAHVTMFILNGVHLPPDTRALIKAQGILGDKYIELDPGVATGQPLQSGGRITNTETAQDLGVLLQKLGTVADDLKILTSALVSNDGGQDLRAIVRNIKDVSESLDHLIETNGPGLSRTLANLERVATNLENITQRISSGEGTLGHLLYDETLVGELRSSLANLRDITSRINSGEGTIGRLINDETTINRIDEALESVNSYLSAGNSISVDLDFRMDFMTRYSFVKGQAGVKIFTSPDRYYLLGVTGDYFGSYERTDYTTPGGNYYTESRNRSKLKINAQIAQRFYDLVIRGGVMESGAGIALDYYLLDDDLKLTFEGFSGDFKHNPHLRTFATYRIWKLFYLSAGYDDFISDLHRASPFIGLGLWFTDDDLKLLLGGMTTFL
jgi:phospholipid/cholesterol/gamma-HCH transport system substrate-binding protein